MRPARTASTSARIETAVSAGVCAPRSSPAGPARRSSCSSVRPASSNRSRRFACVRREPIAPDVEGVARQRRDQRRDVEPVLVREHDDRGVGVGGQLVRPGDRELVGARQPLARDERGPWVDHLGAPAERLGAAAELLGGVDPADHDEARRRTEHLHEDLDAVQLEHAARPRRHVSVDSLAGALALEHRQRDRRLLRQLALEGLDEDVDLAAAGQADRQGELVLDAVGQEPGPAVGQHLGRGARPRRSRRTRRRPSHGARRAPRPPASRRPAAGPSAAWPRRSRARHGRPAPARPRSSQRARARAQRTGRVRARF